MAEMHTVEQGECLSSIAKEFGFSDWRTIYNHAQNADFRRLRPNPNLIFPGDRIFIPDKQTKDEARATDAEHPFQLNVKTTTVRIRLRDEKDEPFKNKKIKLVIAGETQESSTPDDGMIQMEVPADARSGQLTVWFTDDTTRPGFVWNLKIGHLDPPETNSGVQARLKNLGFDCGPVDGIVGPRTKAALKGFQSTHGLSESGAVDDATRDALRQKHDEA
jgi:hypothetical protein